MEKLGYSRQRLTSHMRDIVNEIMDYRIRVAAYDKDTNECMQLSAVNVFSKCSAHARQGAMTVKLNPDIADYFLNQRRNYTKYNLAIAASVNSYPAAKLHEVLICRARQYGVNLLRFSIDELRVLLTPMSKAAEKGKKKKSETAEEKRRREHRQSNGVFANNVIKNAVETINQSTECEVYFRTIRSGRNVVAVRFYVDDYTSIENKKEAFLLREKLGRTETDLERINEILDTGEGEICPEEIIPRLSAPGED